MNKWKMQHNNILDELKSLWETSQANVTLETFGITEVQAYNFRTVALDKCRKAASNKQVSCTVDLPEGWEVNKYLYLLIFPEFSFYLKGRTIVLSGWAKL